MTRAVLGDSIALISRRQILYNWHQPWVSQCTSPTRPQYIGYCSGHSYYLGRYQDTQRDPNNGGFGGECKNDKILKLIVYWRASWYSAQAFDASSPSSLSFRKLFLIDSLLSIYLTTGLTELGLRLLSLLHSPENEGKLDHEKDCWSIHVHSPRA